VKELVDSYAHLVGQFTTSGTVKQYEPSMEWQLTRGQKEVIRENPVPLLLHSKQMSRILTRTEPTLLRLWHDVGRAFREWCRLDGTEQKLNCCPAQFQRTTTTVPRGMQFMLDSRQSKQFTSSSMLIFSH